MGILPILIYQGLKLRVEVKPKVPSIHLVFPYSRESVGWGWMAKLPLFSSDDRLETVATSLNKFDKEAI